jgi:CDP-diacylglycerol---glycerol-3-phosphate 3-phosphatidyltransferase
LLASILFVLASITDGRGWVPSAQAQPGHDDGHASGSAGRQDHGGGALVIALVAYIPEVVKVWIAVVIIGREFLVSGSAVDCIV